MVKKSAAAFRKASQVNNCSSFDSNLRLTCSLSLPSHTGLLSETRLCELSGKVLLKPPHWCKSFPTGSNHRLTCSTSVHSPLWFNWQSADTLNNWTRDPSIKPAGHKQLEEKRKLGRCRKRAFRCFERPIMAVRCEANSRECVQSVGL